MDNLELLLSSSAVPLQLLVDGVLVGAIFALAAYGMALVWGVMRIINVAQGEFVILGGYMALLLVEVGIHPLLGVPFAALAVGLVGWIGYRSVIFRIVDRDLFTSLLATFGISILLAQFMNQVFGADVRTAQSGLGVWQAGAVTISQIKVLSFVLALLLGLVLVWFLRRARLGQAIRATAQNPRAARIMGIDTDRVFAATFTINAAICGAAGALVVMTWIVHPFLGLAYTVRAFMIVVVAGLGNLATVIVAGIGLGTAENFAGFILGAEFQAAFVYGLLVVILVWRNFRLSRRRQYLS